MNSIWIAWDGMSDIDFVRYVVEDLLSDRGTLSYRAMFGAFGLYKEGVMFAVVDEDELFLKVNDTTKRLFQAAGSRPLTYEARGKEIALSYWSVPAYVMDDREELGRWVDQAWQVAMSYKES